MATRDSSGARKRRLPLPILIIVIAAALLLAGAAGFVVWAESAAPADSIAMDALADSDTVAATQDGRWLVFTPKRQRLVAAGSAEAAADTVRGFIFYPGGRVDHRAYAPALRAIAEAGYLVVVPAMPLHLAVFDPTAADAAMETWPMIKTWAIGGHSLGGAMATDYLAKHPAAPVAGLVLWGSYAIGDLSSRALPTLSVAGSLDGLSTPAKIKANAAKLPATTRFEEIAGANHAQFGSYGPQNGDNAAAIAPSEQRARVVALTLAFLDGLAWN